MVMAGTLSGRPAFNHGLTRRILAHTGRQYLTQNNFISAGSAFATKPLIMGADSAGYLVFSNRIKPFR
jgi:hypothetical protein